MIAQINVRIRVRFLSLEAEIRKLERNPATHISCFLLNKFEKAGADVFIHSSILSVLYFACLKEFKSKRTVSLIRRFIFDSEIV